jgi:hypothetical protein
LRKIAWKKINCHRKWEFAYERDNWKHIKMTREKITWVESTWKRHLCNFILKASSENPIMHRIYKMKNFQTDNMLMLNISTWKSPSIEYSQIFKEINYENSRGRKTIRFSCTLHSKVEHLMKSYMIIRVAPHHYNNFPIHQYSNIQSTSKWRGKVKMGNYLNIKKRRVFFTKHNFPFDI